MIRRWATFVALALGLAIPGHADRQGQALALERGSDAGLRAVIPLSKLDPDAPVSIAADELEVIEQADGSRTLSFRGKVRVSQADLSVRADQLEAVYGAGQKQPDRLSARGNVRVRKGEREARCDRAVYARRAQTIRCVGNARVRDQADEVRGDVIVFDLEASRITVDGATEVALTPSVGDTGNVLSPIGDLDLAGGGPVRIQAKGLSASQTEAGRRLSFAGSVEVLQDDLALEAKQIEALYPPDAEEPALIVATGDVKIRQGDREATCARAEYSREHRFVECRGAAQLARRGDSVIGERIEFDLEAERLRVVGGARLILAPRSDPRGRATP